MLSEVCPYLETRQPHEGDEGDTEPHAEEVHERSVRCVLTFRLGSLLKATMSLMLMKSMKAHVLTLRLGSLTKAMKATQSPMPRKSISA